MKILIVEDDFTSRLLLQEVLKSYGKVELAVDGQEAVDAFQKALDAGEPYQLICLDIMMPVKDGHQTLREIRALEEKRGLLPRESVKIIMTTALNDPRNVMDSYHDLCDAYLIKPVDRASLLKELLQLGITQ
jgi:two-component system chemotaxis response regulator CheY